MNKALIIFGTTTGNTESMSEIIEQALVDVGCETEVKNVVDAQVADLTAEHDVLLLGCAAYGEDTIELQDDFDEFYQQLDGTQLNGKKVAVFAPGDSSYEYFCGSVDMLEEKMEDLGGELVTSGLKIDGDPDDSKDEIVAWANSIAESIA
jgi:flavodoxin short chain